MRMPLPDVFIGRQPILDRERHVVAYELLFRSSKNEDDAHVTDDTLATAQVVTRVFYDLGIHAVVGKSMAFVNLDAASLMSTMIETLPRDRVVLELLETIDIDRQVVRRCRKLKAMGYRLALDDFFHYEKSYEPLLDVVDIVKVDMLLLDPESLSDLVRLLKPWQRHLLAEKVECLQRARQCLALGFEFFQGFFFGRPAILAA